MKLARVLARASVILVLPLAASGAHVVGAHADSAICPITGCHQAAGTASNESGVEVTCNDGSGLQCLDIPIECSVEATQDQVDATVAEVTKCAVETLSGTVLANLGSSGRSGPAWAEVSVPYVQIKLQQFQVCMTGDIRWTDTTATPVATCDVPLNPLLPGTSISIS